MTDALCGAAMAGHPLRRHNGIRRQSTPRADSVDARIILQLVAINC